MTTKCVFFAFVLFCANLASYATSVSTPAGRVMFNFAIAVDSYSKAHDGRLPTSMNDLEGRLNLRTFPVQEIQLLDKPIAIEGGELIAITVRPVSEDRKGPVGRYLTYLREDGKIRSDWRSDEELRPQFANHGITLSEDNVWVQPSTKLMSPNEVARLPQEEQDRIYQSIRDLKNASKEGAPPSSSAVLDSSKELPAPKPAIEEEPTEVVVTKPIEEDVEQSSQWWLWLVGALVVVSGIGLAVRRKS